MNRERKSKYKEIPSYEFLLLRDRLGLGRYLKSGTRNEEKRKVLLELALKKIEESERNDYVKVGTRKRKLKI